MTARAAVNVVRTARTEHLADYGKRLCPVDYAAVETAIEDKISSGSLRVPGVTRTPSNWSQPCSTAAAAHPGQQPLAVEDVLAALPMDLQSEADGDVLDPFGARGEGAASATGGRLSSVHGLIYNVLTDCLRRPRSVRDEPPTTRRIRLRWGPSDAFRSFEQGQRRRHIVVAELDAIGGQPASKFAFGLQTPRPCFRDDTMIDAASEATR
jgi:hypothetical protein